jgi:hypothetical protein
LGIGIWAIVALFPTGQNIIRRSGLRQMATQLAHEAISEFLADPAKMPFAIVPFDPADPQIANRPVLLEPADLLTVRYTYNFVWGEPLDDGLPPGDPNKRVGLVGVDTNNDGQPDQWRAILRFAPAAVYRVYREVRYRRVDNPPSSEFEFSFDASTNQIRLYMYVNRPNEVRIFRVTYPSSVNPLVPVIVRELYLVPTAQGQFDLRAPAIGQPEVVEEYPIDPASFVFANGVLTFNNPMPGPSSGITPNQLGFLRVDYLVADPQLGDHWIVETGTTFDPDPSLRQKLNIPLQGQATVGIFQTTFGGIPVDPNTNRPIITAITLSPNRFGLPLFPAPVAPNPSPNGNSLPQEGLLVLGFDPSNTLPVPPNERVRVAYRAGDDPNTPVDESWFLQVIKPPDDFQLFTQADQQVLSTFPFEQLRWFTAQLIPDDPRTPLVVDPYFRLQFSALLAGLNVQVRYQVRYFNPNPRQTHDETYSEVKGIDSNGAVTIPIPLPPQGWTVDLNNTKIEEVRGASLLVRVSGGSMWRQSPPKTRADYVELATIVPPPAKLTQP